MNKVKSPLKYAIRHYSNKPITPFKESHLKGDQKFQDLNNYYSDLFTGSEPVPEQINNNTLQDDIAEINSELNELYGMETPMDIHPQQPIPKESLLDKIKSNTPKIFISNSTNPFMNLALEDYIFQHTPISKPFTAQRLIFYTNSPCVVIGKNQNPWRETNFPLLNNLQIPLLRRRSGGGTVVHDLGNVNYSYITTRDMFSRSYFGKLIVDVINESMGLGKIKQNERGDIVTMNNDKLSGSAFKISRGKSYHHGTMLLNSNLDVLKKLLNKKERENVMEFECNAVDSVSSPVTNLGLDNGKFIELVQDGFKKIYGSDVEVVEINDDDEGFKNNEIAKIGEELHDWKWRFGGTPPFEMKLHNEEFNIDVCFKVEKGYLKKIDVNTSDDDIKKSFQYLLQVVEAGEPVKFKGSDIAGFILHDELSEWIGNQIDGTN